MYLYINLECDFVTNELNFLVKNHIYIVYINIFHKINNK